MDVVAGECNRRWKQDQRLIVSGRRARSVFWVHAMSIHNRGPYGPHSRSLDAPRKRATLPIKQARENLLVAGRRKFRLTGGEKEEIIKSAHQEWGVAVTDYARARNALGADAMAKADREWIAAANPPKVHYTDSEPKMGRPRLEKPRLCSDDDCDSVVHAKGLCRRHYDLAKNAA